MKKLNNILFGTSCISVKGSTDISVEHLSFDSRDIKPQTLFIAIKGTITDGHKYIQNAVSGGAYAVVCERLPDTCSNDVTYVVVKDSAEALGIISANFYNHPSKKFQLIGVTGTNGKTTIATLLHRLFTDLGYHTGLLSTISISIKSQTSTATHTTPDALSLNRILAEMVQENVTHCFMEVSSHAISQKRIAGLSFAGGIFTNITHDHLDYHASFSDYLHVKKSFFDRLPKTAFALSNTDDLNGAFMLQNTKAKKYYYGIKKMADYKCKIIENHFEGINLLINQHNVWFKLPGEFNAYNLLAVYATAVLLGENETNVLRGLSKLEPVEGRFQYFVGTGGVVAIVDYAHSPDALKNVLNTIHAVRNGDEKLITVIGCGGDRDKTKRPLMAKVAAEKSDVCVFTSDNPRSEDPNTIIQDMINGLDIVSSKRVVQNNNRKEAIKMACTLAQKGDIVLVAGKGHEKYQEIMGEKQDFDDMAVLKEFLLNN